MPADVDLDTIFASLPRHVRAKIGAMATERKLARGQVLFRAGDEAEALYVVLSGRLRVSRETQRRAGVLHAEAAGGIVGEIPVFGGGRFPATATATEPTRCAQLPKSGVERLLRESPEFSRFALERLARRAQSLLTRIDELTSSTITARVARHFIERSRGRAELSLGMSQETLAAELGTAREVVVRAIRELVEMGTIRRVGRSTFAIADAERLRSVAQSERS